MDHRHSIGPTLALYAVSEVSSTATVEGVKMINSKFHSATRILFTLLIPLLFVEGCAIKAYEGPELPKSEIAVLHGSHSHGGVLLLQFIFPSPGYKHVTRVAEIDGLNDLDRRSVSLCGEVDINRRKECKRRVADTNKAFVKAFGVNRNPGASPSHILPGSHTARVIYWRYPDITLCPIGGFTGPGGQCFHNYTTWDLSIVFTAKAGHEYRIPAERRNGRDWIWVEDITIGKVVAGEKPPALSSKQP